jgi:hypothetical protein
MNPEQAFNVIARVVDAHLCNKQERVVLDQAMQLFAGLANAALQAQAAAQAQSAAQANQEQQVSNVDVVPTA